MNKKNYLINLCCRLNPYKSKIIKNQNNNSLEKDINSFNILVDQEIKEKNIIQYIYTGIKNDTLLAKRI